MELRHFGNEQLDKQPEISVIAKPLKEGSLPTVGFFGRVLAQPVGELNGSAHVDPSELNWRE